MGTLAGRSYGGWPPTGPRWSSATCREDIAAVVAFLAGPDSSWISGQNLPADGGLLP